MSLGHSQHEGVNFIIIIKQLYSDDAHMDRDSLIYSAV